jgi:hypothetical protein
MRVRFSTVGRGLLLCLTPASYAVASPQDADGDGLPDAWEGTHLPTHPYSADTDGDGLADHLDLAFGRAWAPDRDQDGLNDLEEFHARTSPHRADTDGDGHSDALELDAGWDPLVPGPGPTEASVEGGWVLERGCGTLGVDPVAARVAWGGEFWRCDDLDGLEVTCVAPAARRELWLRFDPDGRSFALMSVSSSGSEPEVTRFCRGLVAVGGDA